MSGLTKDEFIRAVTKSVIIIFVIIAAAFVFGRLFQESKPQKTYSRHITELERPSLAPMPAPAAPAGTAPAGTPSTSTNHEVAPWEYEMLSILEDVKHGHLHMAEQKLRRLEKDCLADPRCTKEEITKINESINLLMKKQGKL